MSCPVHTGDHGPEFRYAPCGAPAVHDVHGGGEVFTACASCARKAWINGCDVPDLDEAAANEGEAS